MQRLLTLCALLLLAAPPVAAQGQHAGANAAALERWKQHSPEQRAALHARFEAFKNMDAGQRDELRARFERLRQAEQRVRRELSPELQAQVAGLDPHERREFLRENLAHEFNRCGKRIGELLPPELRTRLESAGPQERMQLMGQLRERCDGDKLVRGLVELGRRLEFAQPELDALAELEPQAQRAKLLELRRRELVQRVEREGLPAWVDAQEWADWAGLDDREFCSRVHAKRDEGRGEGRGDEQGGSELWRLMRPDPSWFDELSDLEPEARRAEFERRMAARFLDYLAAHPERTSLEELQRLRALPPSEVLQAVRERQRGGRGERNERRGPGQDR